MTSLQRRALVVVVAVTLAPGAWAQESDAGGPAEAFADAGPVEGQALDAGPSDAGVVEPGPLDAGEVAALAVDAGSPGDGAEVALTTVVTGSRTPSSKADAVVATEVITRAQIEAADARDLAQQLQQAQGVETTDSFRGTGVRLQGLDSEYVLLLIDGERINGRV
ncbi:MAG: TonB-dependent receptor plug domain-containing protein, partial [Myxococcaceae bacterium]|nr:TonB-dependent receptor plug domain-containing protein [Myxococcaceae bacterium]